MGNEETSAGPTGTRRLSDHGLFAVTFASGAAPVILVDRERIVVGWNRAAERLFGWSASDIVGHGLDATTPLGAGDLFGSAVDAVVQGRPIEPFAATCFAKDGQPMRLRVHVAPVVTDEGDVVRSRSPPETTPTTRSAPIPSDWRRNASDASSQRKPSASVAAFTIASPMPTRRSWRRSVPATMIFAAASHSEPSSPPTQRALDRSSTGRVAIRDHATRRNLRSPVRGRRQSRIQCRLGRAHG